MTPGAVMRGQLAFAQGTVTRRAQTLQEAAFHEQACLPWNSARSVEANKYAGTYLPQRMRPKKH